MFHNLGIPYTKLFINFVEKAEWRRKYWRRYQQNFKVKRKRAYKKKEIEKKVLLEMHAKDPDYASGRGLDIGFDAPPKKKRRKLTKCRCGSTTHLTTNSKKCPLNRANLKVNDFEQEQVSKNDDLSINRATNVDADKSV